jgi:hypothetical protein
MIRIVENFFTDEELVKIQTYANRDAYFNTSFFDYVYENKDTDEKRNRDTSYGLRHTFGWDENFLGKVITKNALEKFKVKILKTVHNQGAIDKRKLDLFQPHQDETIGNKWNLYVQLQGKEDARNGICFYNDNRNMDIHIGFKQNRAVLFRSNLYHTPNVSKDKETWRMTMTIFILKADFIN